MAIIGCYATALPSTLSRRLRAGIGSLLHLTPRRSGAGCTPSSCEAMRAVPQTLALSRGLSADLSADLHLLVLQQPLYHLRFDLPRQ